MVPTSKLNTNVIEILRSSRRPLSEYQLVPQSSQSQTLIVVTCHKYKYKLTGFNTEFLSLDHHWRHCFGIVRLSILQEVRNMIFRRPLGGI